MTKIFNAASTIVCATSIALSVPLFVAGWNSAHGHEDPANKPTLAQGIVISGTDLIATTRDTFFPALKKEATSNAFETLWWNSEHDVSGYTKNDAPRTQWQQDLPQALYDGKPVVLASAEQLRPDALKNLKPGSLLARSHSGSLPATDLGSILYVNDKNQIVMEVGHYLNPTSEKQRAELKYFPKDVPLQLAR